jgi:hypothetical protein
MSLPWILCRYLVNRGLVGNIPPELGSLSALANL